MNFETLLGSSRCRHHDCVGMDAIHELNRWRNTLSPQVNYPLVQLFCVGCLECITSIRDETKLHKHQYFQKVIGLNMLLIEKLY